MGGGPPGFARRSTCAALLRMPLGRSGAFGHGPLTLSGAAFQPLRPSPRPPTSRSYQPPGASAGVWAMFRFRSPLPAESLSLPLPPPTEMFHFGGSRPARRHAARWAGITRPGLPHSDTPGSKRARRSPGLIAACRVLRRPLAPRHPSCAQFVARPPGLNRPGAGSWALPWPCNLSLPLHLNLAARLSKNPRARAPGPGAARGNKPNRRTAPMGLTGLEPVTPRLSSACSDQLSYRPAPPRAGGSRARTGDPLLAKQALCH